MKIGTPPEKPDVQAGALEWVAGSGGRHKKSSVKRNEFRAPVRGFQPASTPGVFRASGCNHRRDPLRPEAEGNLRDAGATQAVEGKTVDRANCWHRLLAVKGSHRTAARLS